MAKIEFDFLGKPTTTQRPEDTKSRLGDRRTAAGPEPHECGECGNTTGPHWGEQIPPGVGRVDYYCSRCVPDHLRYPNRRP